VLCTSSNVSGPEWEWGSRMGNLLMILDPRAAAELGLERTRLHKRIRALGLNGGAKDPSE
jgi:hypothetical protein